MSHEYCHNITSVALRTGLSPHVIRIWERRYQAIEPNRTCSNRRLYGENEIERLILLKRLTMRGHRIGLLAPLSMEELRSLHDGTSMKVKGRTGSRTIECCGLACLERIMALDGPGLQALFEESLVNHGFRETLRGLLAPLIEQIGLLWAKGELGISHEHLATACIREFLAIRVRPYAMGNDGPEIIVTTPSGQWHELGAMLVAAYAWNAAWKVVYLGASIPAEDIVAAVQARNAKAVALSLVYPLDDKELPGELKRLRQLLPADIPIVAGGRGIPSYHSALCEIGAHCPNDIDGLLTLLRNLQGDAESPGTPAAS